MATESLAATKSNSSTADSYIGSLISLTSKAEIRYEGVLYNINTEESSIGLINVRSYGTEGRKKDGPQVAPGDKVYEYILFRGTDIKDLQVKSSPSVQHTPPINNDPAIIQSHYPRPVATSTSLPFTGSGSLPDIGSHNAQMGLPGSNFQGGLSPYQPGGNLGSWGAIPTPTANGGGLAIPMYWQGFYPPNGPPHLHQQSLLRPPPGLAMPPSMQQPMQYPNFNAPLPSGASNPLPSRASNPLPSGASNLPGASNFPGSNMPEVSSSLLPVTSSSLNLMPTSLPPSTLPSSLLMPSASAASETLPSSLPNKAHSSTIPTATFGVSLPSLTPLTTSSLEVNPIVPSSSNKPNAVSVPVLPYKSSSQSMSSIVGTSSSIPSETPVPSLVTPGQLLQSVPTIIPSAQTASSSQSAQTAHKDVEVVQVSSPSLEPSARVARESQPPILPLPVPPRGGHKTNVAPFQARYGYRGRERGRGAENSRPVTNFSEDFDFIAMNEKFKKDEVWDHLGKSNKSHSKDKEGDGQISDGDDSEDEDDAGVPQAEQPVYNKDDFFDSLSSNTRDYESQNGRMRFSEQRKLDTETFGDFSRHRGGRGGRWPGRGGRSRGSYYGRGYAYAGRGQGRSMPSRPY